MTPTWSFSIQGFDDDKFKSYYKAFDYVLNRLGKEVDVLRVSHNFLLKFELFHIFNLKFLSVLDTFVLQIENFERYVSNGALN